MKTKSNKVFTFLMCVLRFVPCFCSVVIVIVSIDLLSDPRRNHLNGMYINVVSLSLTRSLSLLTLTYISFVRAPTAVQSTLSINPCSFDVIYLCLCVCVCVSSLPGIVC